MERLDDLFTLELKKMPSFSLVVIQKEHKDFLVLKVLHEFTDVLIDTIKEYKELIEKPKQKNLFDTESLQDHFNKLWFHQGTAERSIVSLIEDSLQALCEDSKKAEPFYQMKEESDEELISQLLKDSPIKDVKMGRLTKDELTTLTEVLGQIRSHYDIQKIEAMDLDDFIMLTGEKYLLQYLPDIKKAELGRIAFNSKTSELFKKKILSMVKPSSNMTFVDDAVVEKDGYRAQSKRDIESPVVEISYLGSCSLYRGIGEVPYYMEEYVLKEHSFWSEVWYELARGHEKYLLDLKNEKLLKLKGRIQQLENQQKIYLGHADKNLREGFAAVQSSVAERLNVSPTTVAKDEKKALGIIKEYMHKKGLAFEDLVCA